MVTLSEFKDGLQNISDRFCLCMFAPVAVTNRVNRRLNELFGDSGNNLSVALGDFNDGGKARFFGGNYASASLETAQSVVDVFGDTPEAVLLVTRDGQGPQPVVGVVDGGRIFTYDPQDFHTFARDYLGAENLGIQISEGDVEAHEVASQVSTDQRAPSTAPTHTDIEQIQASIARNREDLLPTLAALLGYIKLERERLRARNHRDDEDEENTRRQIELLDELKGIVERLVEIVSASDFASKRSAAEVESLTNLYSRKFVEWPRNNADELVDKTYRAALVGLTAVTLPLFGVGAVPAVIAGLVMFAGKEGATAIKAAKETAKDVFF